MHGILFQEMCPTRLAVGHMRISYVVYHRNPSIYSYVCTKAQHIDFVNRLILRIYFSEIPINVLTCALVRMQRPITPTALTSSPNLRYSL